MAAKKPVVFIIVLFLVSHVSGEGECPDNFDIYVPSTGSCLVVISEISKTFDEARSWCHSQTIPSGFSTPDLAVVDRDTHEKLKPMLRGIHVDRLWIGLRETFIDWTWVSTNKPLGPQGCFNRDSLFRDSLDVSVTAELGNVTNSRCQQTCLQKGYTYAGVFMVETEAHCNCGDNFSWRFEDKIPTECDARCPADPREKCGNKDKVLVYRVKDASKTNLWLSNEPNNYDGYAKCLTLTSWSARKWDDRKCAESQDTSHICQYADSDACDGYYFAKTRTCFKLFPDTGLTWFEARSECMKQAGDLIVIDSPELHSFVIEKPEIRNENRPTHWWIGAHSSQWTWMNDQPLAEFTNWDLGNPAKPKGHCVAIHVNSGGGNNRDENKKYKWEDNDCEMQYGFICEAAIPSKTPPTAPTARTAAPTERTTAATATATATTATTTTTTTSPPESSIRVTTKQASTTSGNGGEDAGERTSGSRTEVIFSNGVIVAIVIASVAVLVASVRLFVYCCHRRRSPSEDRRGLSP